MTGQGKMDERRTCRSFVGKEDMHKMSMLREQLH